MTTPQEDPQVPSASEAFTTLADRFPGFTAALEAYASGDPAALAALAPALNQLAPGELAELERLTAAVTAAASTELADVVSSLVSDDDIIEVMVAASGPDDTTEVTDELLANLAGISAMAHRLASDASDIDALRVLLAAGFADQILGVAAAGPVPAPDTAARQMAVTRLATTLRDAVTQMAHALHSARAQMDGQPIHANLGSANDTLNGLVRELLGWYPDVVAHFDALFSARAERELDTLL